MSLHCCQQLRRIQVQVEELHELEHPLSDRLRRAVRAGLLPFPSLLARHLCDAAVQN